MTAECSSEVRKLFTWAKKRGIILHPDLLVVDFGAAGGRGLAASVDIEENTAIIEVPVKAALSTVGAWSRPTLTHSDAADVIDIAPELVLAIQLHLESLKGDTSEYAEWIATLCKTIDVGNSIACPFENTPRQAAAKFTEKLLEQLEVKVLPWLKAEAKKGSIDGLPENHSKEALEWALFTVLSRSHAINTKMTTEDKHLYMLPVVDLLNHTFGTETECTAATVSFTDDVFSIRSARKIVAGEQITISYGPKDNTQLLSTYGFCVDPNPFDTAEIGVPLWTDSDPAQLKMAKQSFGTPFLLQRRAQGTSTAASNTEITGLISWQADNSVLIGDELLMGAKIGSATTMPELAAAFSQPPSEAAWNYLADAFDTAKSALAKTKQADCTADPGVTSWYSARLALLEAAMDQVEETRKTSS